MKAIQITAFGDTSVLTMHGVDKPSPKANEVLIKIAATSINPLDIKIRTGSMQQVMPVQLPFTPGTDLAGVIEAKGEEVSRLKVGDMVFATTFGGTYAEYIVMHEKNVSTIPQNVKLDEAVALAVPLSTAYTLLVDEPVEAGQRILIHGAAGAVGAVAVQMAKALGAYVIGTATGEGLALLKSLGADEVIDYKNQDFSSTVKDVDRVLDLVGGETQKKSYAILKKGGTLLSTVMPTSDELAQQYGISAKFVNSMPSLKKLTFGKNMVEENKIKPHIAKTLKLEDAALAQDLVSKGGLNGKIVLEVG